MASTVDPTPDDIEAVVASLIVALARMYQPGGTTDNARAEVARAAWHAVVARVEARMRPALEHAYYREHPWTEWCDGCASLAHYFPGATEEGKSDGE